MNELNPSKEAIARDVVDTIIKSVHLHHLNKDEIKMETPLTAGGLNLDSIDILEVVIAVEHHFGVKVTDAETGKKHFGTISSITDFIYSQKGTN